MALIMNPHNGAPAAQHMDTKTLAVPAASGTVGNGFLQPSTITLTGRTTVG